MERGQRRYDTRGTTSRPQLVRDGYAIMNNPNQRVINRNKLDNFINDHTLCVVVSLEEIGTPISTAPNGNCGYEALILGCWYHGLLDWLIKPDNKYWTEEEREQDRAIWRTDIKMMRWLLSRNYQLNWRKFQGDEGYHRAAETADGAPLVPFTGKFKSLMSRIRDKIYDETINFSNGCPFGLWADLQHTWAIASFMKKHSIVVYTAGSRNARCTHIFHYDKSMDKVTLHVQEKSYLTPPANAICVVHDGSNHYDYLCVDCITVNQIFEAVRKYGIIQTHNVEMVSDLDQL